MSADRVLLDTHVLVWWELEPRRISRRARAVIEHPDSELYVSDATVWEMAIKKGLGKLDLPVSLDAFVLYARQDLGSASRLPIRPLHLLGVEQLEMFHRDPFDRLLVSQAHHENLALLSADARLDPYPVRRVWD